MAYNKRNMQVFYNQRDMQEMKTYFEKKVIFYQLWVLVALAVGYIIGLIS
jgi:hypothetical protein